MGGAKRTGRYAALVRRVRPELTTHARALRTGATEPGVLLWLRWRRYRPKFTRQLVVDPYIIDLACRQARLGVEIDGSQHADAIGYDERRSHFLAERGWRIVRYSNNDLRADPDTVAEDILRRVAECLGDTHPQPLPSREGRPRSPRYG